MTIHSRVSGFRKPYKAPEAKIRSYVPLSAVMLISGTGSGDDWEDPGDD